MAVVGVIFAVSIFLGLLVYLADKKEGTNKYFFGFTLSAAFLILFAFLSEFFPKTEPQLSLILSRLVFALAILLMIFFFFFSYVFPLNKKLPVYYFWSCVIVGTVSISLTLFTPLIIGDLKLQPWGFDLIYGKLYNIIFLPVSLFLAILSFLNLILNYRISNKVQRTQLILIFRGLGVFLLAGVFFGAILPLITNSQEYYRLGNYSAIFFVIFTAYAITKHRLFDIRVITTETLVALIVLVLFIQTLLSQTWIEGLFRGAFLILVVYFGYLLIQSVLREISQREQLEKLTTELKVANTRLKELDAMKSEFVSMASHELLTPISAIEGYLSMMLDEKLVKIDDPKAIQYMDRVYKSSRRLARLVADLLNVSRIEQGRLLVEKQVVEMGELIKSVMEELKFKAEEARLALESKLNVKSEMLKEEKPSAISHKPLAVYGDPDKIKEILINLAGNALKFTPPGGKVEVGAELWPTNKVVTSYEQMAGHVKTSRALPDEALQSSVNEKFREMVGDKQLVVSVKDTGIGLAEEDIGHLFQKFSRLGDWTTREVAGTGLGLYISKALAEMHHGRIWVESEGKGKGSTFYFSLPLAENRGEVERLDSQVPRAKDAKPLARMG
jgi:signal transduction histidine kinase